jgi:SAM-dependent methyltransferase
LGLTQILLLWLEGLLLQPSCSHSTHFSALTHSVPQSLKRLFRKVRKLVLHPHQFILDSVGPIAPRYVVLKADDLRLDRDLAPWQTLWKRAHELGIPISCGVIGESLQNASEHGTKLTRAEVAKGLHEFWNHGFVHFQNSASDSEFRGASLENQQEALKKTQELMFKKLGLQGAIFGAPFNQIDATTTRALVAEPSIKGTYFSSHSPLPCLPSHCFINFEAPSARVAWRNRWRLLWCPLVVVQFHPDQLWNQQQLNQFWDFVLKLKKSGATFVKAATALNLKLPTTPTLFPAAPKPVSFLSFDVEALPGRAPSDHVNRLVWGRSGPEEWGIQRICAVLAKHNIRANFMIDMAMCHLYGDHVVKEIGDYLLSQGHEIHAHLHAEWTVRLWRVPGKFKEPTGINQLPPHVANAALQYAAFKFRQLFGFTPFAFRSGAYYFNKYTIHAAKQAGFAALTNFNSERHQQQWQIEGPASDNNPFVWENGVIEIPVDCSPEPLNDKWQTYIGYFDRVRARKTVKTFNLTLHSWSLSRRENEHHTHFEPAHEQRLNEICEHLNANTTPSTYAAHFASHTLSPVGSHTCLAPVVTAPPPKCSCNICGFLYYKVPDTDVCTGCSSRSRHRQLQDIVLRTSNPFVGKKVLANYANSVEKAAFLHVASELHNFDIRPVGEVDFQMDVQNMAQIPSGSFDAFLALHVLNHVKDDTKALSEIHRILKPGGFALLSVPYRDNEPTTTLENTTEHYGDKNLAQYGVGSYRRYGLQDFTQTLKSLFQTVTTETGTDPLTSETTHFFVCEKHEPPPFKEAGYVWHLATGGMTHMLNLMSYSANVCKQKNRKLILQVKDHEAFGVDFNEVFETCNSQLFATPAEVALAANLWKPFDATILKPISNLVIQHNSATDGEWSGYYTLRETPSRNGVQRYLHNLFDEDVTAFTVGLTGDGKEEIPDILIEILQEIRLKRSLVERAHQLRCELPAEYIGCHFRNTDYQDDFILAAQAIKNTSEQTGCKNVFVATDDVSSIARFQNALPELNIFSNKGLKIDAKALNLHNLHYAGADVLAKFGLTKINQHAEFFADVYALSNATVYIPSERSGVRAMVNLFRRYPEILSWFYSKDMRPQKPNIRREARCDVWQNAKNTFIHTNNSAPHQNACPSQNVALGKPFVMSSMHPANPGLTKVEPRKPFFFHTNREKTPSLIIDLEAHHAINSVIIVNRTNGCFARAHDLHIQFFNNLENLSDEITIPVPSDPNFANGKNITLVLPITTKVQARFVRIFSNSETYLHFSDVQVLAKLSDFQI